MSVKPSRKAVPVPDAKDLPLVLVVWDDAWTKLEFDGYPHDAPSGTIRLETPGYLLKNTPRLLTMALERSPIENTVRYVITIPRKMVVSITPIGPAAIAEKA